MLLLPEKSGKGGYTLIPTGFLNFPVYTIHLYSYTFPLEIVTKVFHVKHTTLNFERDFAVFLLLPEPFCKCFADRIKNNGLFCEGVINWYYGGK